MERLQSSEIHSEIKEMDEYFMRIALGEAESAFSEGEVPVGSVLVVDNMIISRAYNTKEHNNDPTAHAEILVIRNGASIIGNWRLSNATLYVTKEPCIMCAGAMINARIGRLVYGCRDVRYGAIESQFRLINDPRLNHQIEVTSGVLADECGEILQRFFKGLRIP
ncbi:MAG: tRNA adenosine(34) deaminase TadA [Thermodesulfovibrionia bacterium]